MIKTREISIKMIGMKRTIVQAATDRVASTGTTLTGKSTGRLTTFDKYT